MAKSCFSTKSAVMLSLLAICSRMQADPIPIVNPSFEDIRGTPNSAHFDAAGRLLDGHWTVPVPWGSDAMSASPLPGWQATASVEAGNPSGGQYFVLAPDGQNIVALNPKHTSGWFLRDPVISQVLCNTLVAGRYNLSFSVGKDSRGVLFPGYKVRLLAGTNVLAQDNNSKVVNAGTFLGASIVVDVPTNHPGIGQLLEIELGASNPPGTDGWVYFDKISLDGPPSPCVVCADSVADFAYTQGAKNWYYGYYNVTDDLVAGYNPTNDFRLLPNAHNADWGYGSPIHGLWNINANFWTVLSAVFGYPDSGTSNGGRTLREQWAVRRWVSQVTGLVRIRGLLAKGMSGGDGVIGAILINGRTVYERRIDGSDGVGADYSVPVGLKQGDFVDFVIKAGGSSGGDIAYFTAIIERAPFTLDIQTAVEVCAPTVPGQAYQFSTDLQNWLPIGDPFTGTGEAKCELFSTRSLGSPGYFRAQAVP